MTYSYIPKGVCARKMDLTLDEDGVITELLVCGGCNGNLQGLRKLIIGKRAEDIIDLLSGIRCENKDTSCPDQLAIALRNALAQQSKDLATE